jgi:starch synthase
MHIVHLAAEFAPIAKAGGLGEVIVGLARELSKSHSKVDVILPKYDFIETSKLLHPKLEVADFKCLESGTLHGNAMWAAENEQCRLHLLESRHRAGYFHRGKIYGCEDDIARFIYFSRAALEYLKLKKEPIDILHLHDWHVSLAAPLARDLFAAELPIKKIVLTIHNIEYQGKCASADLDRIGLQGTAYLEKEKLQEDDPSYPKTINLLKGGIVYSDAVVAVSPTYAKEILTPEMGFHLDATLRKHKKKVCGILNGIDQKLWDPSSDPAISAHFDGERSPGAIQAAKDEAKKALCQTYSLDAHKKPWVGAVTRLVPQKGPELLEEALRQTVKQNGIFALLGSSPIPKIQTHFEQLKTRSKNHPQLLLEFNYNEKLAHQIYAALDFLLVPSHFEPCGLTQLIAMRYGAIPIVRATGGLKDTVFDCDDGSIPIKQRNGFLFANATPLSMNQTLERAFDLFRNNPNMFQSLIRNAVKIDSSWNKPAQGYEKLYRKLVPQSAAPNHSFTDLRECL